MTLDDLDRFMSEPHIGCVTLNIAANGKAYVTVHVRQANGDYKPENQWAASSAEGVMLIRERLRKLPATADALPAPTLTDLLV